MQTFFSLSLTCYRKCAIDFSLPELLVNIKYNNKVTVYFTTSLKCQSNAWWFVLSCFTNMLMFSTSTFPGIILSEMRYSLFGLILLDNNDILCDNFREMATVRLKTSLVNNNPYKWIICFRNAFSVRFGCYAIGYDVTCTVKKGIQQHISFQRDGVRCSGEKINHVSIYSQHFLSSWWISHNWSEKLFPRIFF